MIPGVVSAAFTSEMPLVPGGSTSAFTLRSRHADGGVALVQASPRIVSPDVFRALGMRIRAGRGFSESDTETSPAVAIVNDAFSRRYLGGAALGEHLPMAVAYQDDHREATIIGIVEDVRYPAIGESARPEIYYSFRQLAGKVPVPSITLLLRTSGDPHAAAVPLRGIVHDADPGLAPDGILTMEERVLTSLARPRLYAGGLGAFALFALLIAATGLFGVLSYSVAQRSREIGVRTALGARPADIVRLILEQGLVITLAGVVLGLGAAMAAMTSMSTFLYGVTARDGRTFIAVPALLFVVAAAACLVPAVRAARVDPLRVLKEG
jgi:predicted permease